MNYNCEQSLRNLLQQNNIKVSEPTVELLLRIYEVMYSNYKEKIQREEEIIKELFKVPYSYTKNILDKIIIDYIVDKNEPEMCILKDKSFTDDLINQKKEIKDKEDEEYEIYEIQQSRAMERVAQKYKELDDEEWENKVEEELKIIQQEQKDIVQEYLEL